ncbi:MAG TPA: hypothetical protein VFZ58_03050 [Candidatus Saccharimonadales bacterium]
MKNFIIRSARKSAHIGAKLFHKGLSITTKVENKATRILDGIDYSFKTDETIPLEKIYYNTIPHITPVNPALPAIGSTPSVTLFLPSLDNRSFYGGTATALVVAGRIAQLKKRKLRVVQTLKTGHASNLSDFFKQEGLDIPNDNIKVISVADRAYNVYGYVSMHPDDIFIASAWWDAHLISQLPLKKKFVYLIQDFEPIFYNNSDQYVLAEATYKQNNFIPLCNTKLMYDFMKKRNYAAFSGTNGLWFEPAVSRLKSGLATEKKPGEKKKLFLYGRPDVHRNLFFSALNSIDYAFKAGFINTSEWEVYMAGQDNIPAIKLTSGVTIHNLGKMPMKKYIEFSKLVDLAVSLMMAPHPNYPTLEFASTGTSVVTTKYANKQNLEKYSKNIITSDIDTKSLAGAIKKAASISYSQRIKNAKSKGINDNWSTALNDALSKIVKQL